MSRSGSSTTSPDRLEDVTNLFDCATLRLCDTSAEHNPLQVVDSPGKKHQVSAKMVIKRNTHREAAKVRDSARNVRRVIRVARMSERAVGCSVVGCSVRSRSLALFAWLCGVFGLDHGSSLEKSTCRLQPISRPAHASFCSWS